MNVRPIVVALAVALVLGCGGSKERNGASAGGSAKDTLIMEIKSSPTHFFSQADQVFFFCVLLPPSEEFALHYLKVRVFFEYFPIARQWNKFVIDLLFEVNYLS